MDNKYEKYVDELKTLGNEYHETNRLYNIVERQVLKLKNDRDLVSTKLNELREREKSLINKIEEDTGEKLTNDKIVELLKM